MKKHIVVICALIGCLVVLALAYSKTKGATGNDAVGADLENGLAQGWQGYERKVAESIIATHDTTVFYFMTSWCQASRRNFENNLKPFLGNATEGKAIVVVLLGDSEKAWTPADLNENVFVFNRPSKTPIGDKLFINKECKALFADYKRVNYVPVGIVCNSNREILNWNTDEQSKFTYDSFYPFLQ